MKFFREILNKIKKDKIRNINKRLKPGVYEIKIDIQKSKIRWFGCIIQMGEDRIVKKMLHTKRGKTNNRKTQNHMHRPN